MAKAPKSTTVATRASTAVATKSTMAAVEALRARLNAPTGDKIKISDKQFHLPGGDITDSMDVVIVDFVYYNAYYDSVFDKDNITPPACIALSPEPKGMTPSDNSPDKQNDTCTGCWANEFGSKGKGKACANRILIAVLPADASEDTPLSILDISPTATKGFSSYLGSVARALGKMPYEVITHVECNQSLKYDVAVFSDPQLIDDEAFIGMVESRVDEARERLMTEPDMTVEEKAAPAAKRASKLKGPAKRR